jgi:methionyl-tRNA formyltransferase
MVAADTTRTKYYLRELVRNKFFPAYVLLLLNCDSNLLPGQDSGELEMELVELLENAGIEYEISPNSDINSNEVLTIISNRVESVFIFSGFGGVLLGDDILSSGKKFLHIHGGYLPDYKGSTTNYYSLINENMMGASSIFITKEIDCGPVLLRKKFLPPKERTEIDHVYDSEIRAKVLIKTLDRYVESGNFDFDLENNQGGEVFYVIHPVLKHLSILQRG